VIAGPRRDDAARVILRRKTRDQVETAPHLEGAGRVVVLVLHPDVQPQPLGQERMAEQGCGLERLIDVRARGADVIDCGRLHQRRSSLVARHL
jgi:hypothetical protein